MYNGQGARPFRPGAEMAHTGDADRHGRRRRRLDQAMLDVPSPSPTLTQSGAALLGRRGDVGELWIREVEHLAVGVADERPVPDPKPEPGPAWAAKRPERPAQQTTKPPRFSPGAQPPASYTADSLLISSIQSHRPLWTARPGGLLWRSTSHRTHASLKQGPIVPAARGAANSSRSASAPQCSPLTPRPRRVFDLRGSLDLACHRVFALAPFDTVPAPPADAADPALTVASGVPAETLAAECWTG